MNNKKIVVVGSIAIDNTIFTKELPHAGTTTIADSYFQNIGGKGANQACAALFLGSEVSLIGSVVFRFGSLSYWSGRKRR